MGLDMYLTAKRGFYKSLRAPDGALSKEIHDALAFAGVMPTDQFDVSGVEIRAGYWRKANAIHKWFVDNVQDGKDECQEAAVTRGDLGKLREACVEALAANEAKQGQILPTQAGFFFGSTDYDEGYREDLANTIAIIDKVLTLDDSWDFTYQSSW